MSLEAAMADVMDKIDLVISQLVLDYADGVVGRHDAEDLIEAYAARLARDVRRIMPGLRCDVERWLAGATLH